MSSSGFVSFTGLRRPRYFHTPSDLPVIGGPIGAVVGPFGVPIAVHVPVHMPSPIPIPIHVQVPLFAAVMHGATASASSRVTSISVVVITRARHGGRREILMHRDGSQASILTKELHGRDAHTELAKLVSEHGLTHFGKKTYIEHVYKATGELTLCCVVYASELSRYRINNVITGKYPDLPHFARFLIGSHCKYTIETESHSPVQMSDWVYHLVHSIDELWSNFV